MTKDSTDGIIWLRGNDYSYSVLYFPLIGWLVLCALGETMDEEVSPWAEIVEVDENTIEILGALRYKRAE